MSDNRLGTADYGVDCAQLARSNGLAQDLLRARIGSTPAITWYRTSYADSNSVLQPQLNVLCKFKYCTMYVWIS